MNQSDIQFLLGYDRWAWERVLGQVAALSPEQYTAPAPTPQGSLRGTLTHALSAEIVWLRRFQGESPTSLLAESDVPTFEQLRERWQSACAELDAFVAGLTEEQLGATVAYKTTKGVPMADTLWHLLAHVVNHGTQHRSEAAMILTGYGYSPGNLDLFVFGREEKAAD